MKWTLYIKVRLLVIGILLMVMIVELGMVVALGNQSTARFVNNVEVSTDLLAKAMNTVFNDVNQTLNYIEVELSSQSSSNPDYTSHLMNAAKSREEILNIYIGYEDRTFWLYPETEIEAEFDVTERIWFQGAYVTDGVFWSVPYVDKATGKSIISASKYIELEDRDGVIGIDISLETLSEMIETVNDEGWVMILHQGIIIASTEKSFLTRKFEDLEDKVITKNTPYYGTFLKGDGLYVARRIPGVDLLTLVFIPEELVYGNRRQILTIGGLVTLLLTLIALVTSHFIIRKFTMPISKLKDALVESSLQTRMVGLNEVTNDEINVLIKEYNNLAEHINNQNKRIYTLAYEDELTGLVNRYKFREECLTRIQNKQSTTLFHLDIDNFKYVNDTYGHEIGDKVLKHIADRLLSFKASSEAIARISGDEFVLTINGCDDECCRRISSQLISSLSRPYFINQLSLQLTVSIGIASYPRDANNYDDLLANAEIALYKAKESGKDCFVNFEQVLYKEFLNDIDIETRLIKAIAMKEINPAFQPLVEIETKRIVGFEALARWTDRERGPIYPDVFIPIAERNMSIIPLGWHILDQALKFGKELYDTRGTYYEVGVNVSVIQLTDDRFVDGVFAMLEKYDYPAKYLNLEITESTTLESNEDSMMKLAYLRKKDVNISLDDFGTGYSSLGHLTDLSLSHIKIDRLLVIKAKQSDEVFTLMEGIVGFAHKIGTVVVAEGIEDMDMEEMVYAMNADFGQGYLYGKPMTRADFMYFLDAGIPRTDNHL